jgi:prephenate dehydrogenase (NADP+)
MLRIYTNQWNAYAGLAILNPSARKQIDQFSKSMTVLFMLMLEGDTEGLMERIHRGRHVVFSWRRRR